MKITLTILCVFVSFMFYAFSGLYETTRIGATQLNGNGCVCHSLEESPEVIVWIEGPDTLMKGQTGIYRMFLAGGPAEAGGYNVAGRFGVMGLLDTLSVWDYREPGELTQAVPLPFPSPTDTIFWEFAYTASDSSTTDTLYSCGLSLVWDAIPDSNDRWAFGPKFPLTIIEDNTPVELVSFIVDVNQNGNLLKWITASEINNKGFEIQRANTEQGFVNNKFNIVGFTDGNGTTTSINYYKYFDETRGSFFYRLKQIDYDGSYSYSKIIFVGNSTEINTFTLLQNYPNPFNPETKISFNLPVEDEVTLSVYDINGEKISELFRGKLKEGNHQFNFSGSNLSSGIYLYSLEGSTQKLVKKMLLMK